MNTPRDIVHADMPPLRFGRMRPRLASTLALAATVLLIACDREGKKDCAWTLEPEIKLEGTVDPGFIPVCARNRNTMKQDCRMQTSLEFAKSVWTRKFRYVDLAVKSPALPRTISAIRFCDGRNETLKPESPP